MLRICYGANGPRVTLLTASIYKHMKRSATHVLAKIALFAKLSNFFFDFRPPRTAPRARQRSKYPTTGATRMSPGVAREGWSGLELTDALSKDGVACC